MRELIRCCMMVPVLFFISCGGGEAGLNAKVNCTVETPPGTRLEGKVLAEGKVGGMTLLIQESSMMSESGNAQALLDSLVKALTRKRRGVKSGTTLLMGDVTGGFRTMEEPARASAMVHARCQLVAADGKMIKSFKVDVATDSISIRHATRDDQMKYLHAEAIRSLTQTVAANL